MNKRLQDFNIAPEVRFPWWSGAKSFQLVDVDWAE